MTHRFPVILILGHARCGKDSAAKYLNEAGASVVALADKLKEVSADVLGLPLESFYKDDLKEAPTHFPCFRCPSCGSLKTEEIRLEEGRPPWPMGCQLCGSAGDRKVFESKWTPRMIAQHIGTEGFRAINPSAWVDYVLRHIVPTAHTVITDGRFRSECEGVWKVGGEVWRIKRPGAEGAVGITGHASETEQDSIRDEECQAVILNDSTLETLKGRVLAQYSRFCAERKS